MSSIERASSLKMVLSGEFSEAHPMRDVLWSILREKGIEFGVLWISSPGHEIVGEVGIQWGLYIIGGRVRGANGTGDSAVQQLLTMPKGTFQYIDYTKNFLPELDQGLRVRLSDLANSKRDLSDILSQLSGSKDSRTRMRTLAGHPEKTVVASAPYFSRSWVANQQVVVSVGNWERNTMHHRLIAFWSAFFAFSCVASLIACCAR